MTGPVGASLPGAAPVLKPCPFCGGVARIREDAKGGIVGCFPLDPMKPESDCDRNVTLYIGFSARRGDGIRRSRYNKSDAIAAWNRRAPFPENALPGAALEAEPLDKILKVMRDKSLPDDVALSEIQDYLTIGGYDVPLRSYDSRGEAGPSPAGLTPIQELAQAAQNYLDAEAHVGVTHEMLRELNHRLGSLAGPHLITCEAIAPRHSGNAVLGPPQEKP